MAEYQRISAEEAYAIMQAQDEHILLDVRSDAEYRQKHIPGAMVIPDTEIEERVQTELPDKDALILVYCRSGRRSEIAAREMAAMGYTNVRDFGGILIWPYEVE